MIGNVRNNQNVGFGAYIISPRKLIGNEPGKELIALGRHYEIVGLQDRLAKFESSLDITPHSNRDLIDFYKKSIETTKNLIDQAKLNYEAFIKIIK